MKDITSSPFLQKALMEWRTQHYSRRTEMTNLYWIREFILFNDRRHPGEMENREVEYFLVYLAVRKQVSATTQSQALCAIIFTDRYILNRPIGGLN